MKQVVVFPRGQLTAKDKERLTKAGVIAVEADEPSKVETLLPPVTTLSADEVVVALATAVQHSQQAMLVFGTTMAKRLQSKA